MATGLQGQNAREQTLMQMILTRNLAALGPGLVKGSGSAVKVKWANTFYPLINGVELTAVTTAETAPGLPTGYAPGYASQVFVPANLSQSGGLSTPWPTTLAVVPVLSWFRYLVVHDGTTLFCLPSFIGLASAAAAPDAPPMPAGYICLGDVTVKLAGAATFTPGTTAFDAASVTSVFRDLRWPDTGPSAWKPITALLNVP